jgi:predicted nucleic acid-binding protein
LSLSDDIAQINTIFIDTAPIIYYIEAHPQFGPLVKNIIDDLQAGKLIAFSSVVTLTEVLPKPIEAGDEKLARRFAEFLKFGRNINLIEISERIADKAGRLRGKYSSLRTIDAIQISAALDIDADVFLTNDATLKKIKEINVLVLKDYL